VVGIFASTFGLLAGYLHRMLWTKAVVTNLSPSPVRTRRAPPTPPCWSQTDRARAFTPSRAGGGA
jgi:hypothetical protein